MLEGPDALIKPLGEEARAEQQAAGRQEGRQPAAEAVAVQDHQEPAQENA